MSNAIIVRTSDGSEYLMRDTVHFHRDPVSHLNELSNAGANRWFPYESMNGAPVYVRASSVVSLQPSGEEPDQ